MTVFVVFVLIYLWRESPLSAVTNRFELSRQSRATDAIVLQNLFLVNEQLEAILPY